MSEHGPTTLVQEASGAGEGGRGHTRGGKGEGGRGSEEEDKEHQRRMETEERRPLRGR